VDQLLDKNLTATSFDADAASRPLPSRARTVVVGAGIVGASIAYHLAAAGERDVVVLSARPSPPARAGTPPVSSPEGARPTS
jgi:cation diffusion facilitator CzcD-associated flavoprotein CzcO